MTPNDFILLLLYFPCKLVQILNIFLNSRKNWRKNRELGERKKSIVFHDFNAIRYVDGLLYHETAFFQNTFSDIFGDKFEKIGKNPKPSQAGAD